MNYDVSWILMLLFISSIQYLKVKLTVSIRLFIPLFLHLSNQLTFDNDVSARVGE